MLAPCGRGQNRSGLPFHGVELSCHCDPADQSGVHFSVPMHLSRVTWLSAHTREVQVKCATTGPRWSSNRHKIYHLLFFPFNNFIDLFMAMHWGSQRVRHDWVTELNWTELMLVLHCCMGFSLVAASRGLLLVAVCRLGAAASLIVKQGL